MSSKPVSLANPAPADHPVHALVRERWSPLAFSSRTLEPGVLSSLLEAARWAPSCFNEQPWSFVVARRGEEAFDRFVECLAEANRKWAPQAPVLMLSVARSHFERNGKPNRHAFHDVGLAVGNLLLEATARGLAVHQMAGFDVERARERLAIPEGHEPVAAIAVGYPGDPQSLPEDLRERERAPRARRPLAAVVHAGSWGRSFGDTPAE